MNLNESHERAVKWMKRAFVLMDGLDFETTNKNNITMALLHLSMEHQKAICVLVGYGSFTGSAFALLRPQFEAYIRGLWFNRCATESQVEKFIVGKDPPKIDELIAGIEKTPGFNKHGELKRKKDSLWKNLNDYTHGGIVQVKERNKNSEIVSNYCPEQTTWLLECSSRFSLLAGLEMAGVAQNDVLADELVSEHEKIYQAVLRQ